jgi:hypothetical protein
VIVVPHFGQGADTPAKWVGTRSFAWQREQVNLIFFTFVGLSGLSVVSDSGFPSLFDEDERTDGGLDKFERSSQCNLTRTGENFNPDTHFCNELLTLF